ncbi:copper ABC transporter ATP-binding protein [Denitratisoma sp. DHT3]|uniref:ABC transporter ATP-binding protein n=1 Tax=Denitratisoma sp. DHT3 TaxID=1981880 RepID=UPI001198842B|nr:ABC transporter ATP-binding protein [Denitratisoma sp. DHT3]QDX82171.1 copper ABC transporter ATP-binding protein [Denitratisoma sp. DHT3]
MASNIVEVRQVGKQYGAVRAVEAVDLDIPRGQLFGLIGHNGAGKSTLFKMMLGLLTPSGGRIEIDGQPVGASGFRAVRRKIGYLPENLALYDNLTGLETLAFYARLKAAPLDQCPALLARVGLSAAANRYVREYSKGMRQRLGFAQALLGAPSLLFLDEPTNGLDPEAIRDFYRQLRELGAAGTTIILTSHILSEIQERVDRLAIMQNGRIRAEGSVQALRESVNLPLTFEVRMAPDQIGLARQALAGLPLEPAAEEDGVLRFSCEREMKMRAVAALAALDGRVQDLHVHEPTLEDVFFGYAEGRHESA